MASSGGGLSAKGTAGSVVLDRAISMKTQIKDLVKSIQGKDRLIVELKKQAAAVNGSDSASSPKGTRQGPKKSREELERSSKSQQENRDAENENVMLLTAEVQVLRDENKRLQKAKTAADKRLKSMARQKVTGEDVPRLRPRPSNGSTSSTKRKPLGQNLRLRKKLRTSPVTDSDSESDSNDSELESLGKESSLTRLLKALDSLEPWEDMYKKRPGFSLSFSYDKLVSDNDNEAKKLIDDILAYQFTHRRAIWERLHWVRLPIAPKDPEMKALVRGWKSRYQAASKRWGGIRDRANNMIDRHDPVGVNNESLLEEGQLLTDELWLEPFVWGWPVTTARLPENCKLVEQIMALDKREPARVFFVNDVAKDTYYKATNGYKYTARHLLPTYPSK